jgi:DNA-binding GntR family transcriptional regulator
MKKNMQKISPRTQQERVYTRLREAILNGHFEITLPLIESLWMRFTRRPMLSCEP